MKTNFEVRYANHPEDAKSYDTQKIRQEYLVQNLFNNNEVNLVYTMVDRCVAGGAMPVSETLELEAIDPLKAEFFLERREMGIINVGGKGAVIADGQEFNLDYTNALYLGKGTKKVSFKSNDKNNPAHFYINSALAHKEYPAKKVTLDMAEKVELGTVENSNVRTLNKMIAGDIVETCQLQMGITEVKNGSVWNTMPVHTHDRRMEVYMYFEVPEGQSVCHFMGQTHETRHIWMQNKEAVISPVWSLHAAAGTSSYKFIWGMSGENKEFTDMDGCAIPDLR
jgi:4-deoxy-L-threo-5-hexosulose-uronate ketol-isomerase